MRPKILKSTNIHGTCAIEIRDANTIFGEITLDGKPLAPEKITKEWAYVIANAFRAGYDKGLVDAVGAMERGVRSISLLANTPIAKIYNGFDATTHYTEEQKATMKANFAKLEGR